MLSADSIDKHMVRIFVIMKTHRVNSMINNRLKLQKNKQKQSLHHCCSACSIINKQLLLLSATNWHNGGCLIINCWEQKHVHGWWQMPLGTFLLAMKVKLDRIFILQNCSYYWETLTWLSWPLLQVFPWQEEQCSQCGIGGTTNPNHRKSMFKLLRGSVFSMLPARSKHWPKHCSQKSTICVLIHCPWCFFCTESLSEEHDWLPVLDLREKRMITKGLRHNENDEERFTRVFKAWSCHDGRKTCSSSIVLRYVLNQ